MTHERVGTIIGHPRDECRVKVKWDDFKMPRVLWIGFMDVIERSHLNEANHEIHGPRTSR